MTTTDENRPGGGPGRFDDGAADEAAVETTIAANGYPSERVADARAWFGEFLPDPGDDGAVRLTLLATTGEWNELRPFRADCPPFTGMVPDHAAMLDALAASVIACADEGHNVFCCPYLHPRHESRAKGGAVARRHAHSDVDGPLDLHRVRALGGMAVASGSLADDGSPQGHVYVRLSESVEAHEHEALCMALGQWVGGEFHDTSKVLDNDVLRPAGTLNHKTSDPRPVKWLIGPDDDRVRTWEPETLARLLGVPWPVPEQRAAGNGTPVVDRETRPRAAREGSGGSLARRLDGLAAAVTNAEPGGGNGALNWAAGKAAALCRTADDAPPADEVRASLVAAFLARPIPAGESVGKREREALATVASGWRWGWTHPAEALADRPAHDDEEGQPVSAQTTEDAPAVEVLPDDAEVPEFWEASGFLRSLRDFARARRVGPWALLGAVLARAAASVPPTVVLPPTRGAVASLNLFVALCSESSGGKTTAMEAAREFLAVDGGTSDYLDTQPGSGEGLLSAYCYVKTAKGKAPEVVQTRLSVLFDVDEVQSLGALVGRTNSTLLPFLKSAWSGKTLATQNAEASRLRRVEAQHYRLALVCGVQPVNAGVILDDEGGGFPQRWLWMPTYDPGMLPRDARPTEPPPWPWRVPCAPMAADADGTITWPMRRVLTLPEVAVSAMLDAAETQNRPIGTRAAGATLDGHALLSRAKVAALLALLDGRADVVTEADWRLAGHVMAVSDRTREAIIGVRGTEAQRAEDRKAVRSGRSAAIAADSEAETKTVRAMAVIRRAMERHGGEHSTNALVKFAGSRYRDVAPDALARLAEGSGELVAEERESVNGQFAKFYRLAVES